MMQMRKILVDLSHNETYQRVPQKIFDIDYIFDFTQRGGFLPEFSQLKQYDLIIIGEILPADNQRDHLFRAEEIQSLRRFVKGGGNLLITSSSGGDFNYDGSQGSLRALSALTGVKQFFWGELFNKELGCYYETPENLILTDFPNHPIFKNINRLIFADSTYLKVATNETNEKCKMLLECPEHTIFRSFETEKIRKVGKVPLIVMNSYEEGKTISIANTYFMTPDSKYGIGLADNQQFMKNIIEWLVQF